MNIVRRVMDDLPPSLARLHAGLDEGLVHVSKKQRGRRGGHAVMTATPVAPVRVPEAVTTGRRLGLRDLVDHRATPLVGLVAIFGVSVLVYALLAQQRELPDLFPDEIIYAKLAQ